MASQASTIPENQANVQQISKLIIDKLPGTSGKENRFYYPVSGVTQLIYPDFAPAGEQNSIYYPSYQLSNLYAGYADPSAKGLAPSVTVSFNPNPVTGGFDNIELQTSGLNNFLLQAYGAMTYGIGKNSEADLAKAQATANAALSKVASEIEKAYTSIGGIWTEAGSGIPANPATGSPGKSLYEVAFQSTGASGGAANQVKNSLQQMAGLINNWGDQLLIPGTGIYNAWEAAQTGSSRAKSAFISSLTTSLVSGTVVWNKTFNSGWGPEIENPITGVGVTPYVLPWNDVLYQDYLNSISSSAYTTWKNLTALKSANTSELTNALDYIRGLNQLNSATRNPTVPVTVNKDQYLTIPETPGQTEFFAPRLSATAISGPQTGNSIDFDVSTETESSTTAKVDNKSSVSWDTSAGVSGWFFSASVSNKGNKTTETGWSKFDDKASKMTGTFTWDSISTKQIKRDGSWYLQDALSQAWKNLPANSPVSTGGYAFSTPDLASQLQPAEFYGVSNITYGTPSAVVQGSSTQASKYNTSSFESFQQTTTASAGFGWGPFSIGGSTSYSTSSQKSNKSMNFSSSGSGFKVTNNPLDGLEAVAGAGNPAALLAVQVAPLATSAAAAVAPDNASSSRALERKSKGLSVSYAEYGDVKDSKATFNLGRGKDLFYGNNKSDIINGSNGSDHLAGLKGHDIIDGGNGKDVIFGGHGKDNMTGGKGRDYFVFNKNHINNKHHDTVTDFDINDKLSFTDILPEDLRVGTKRGSTFVAMGNKMIASFENATTELIEAAVENAHHHLTFI